MSHVQGSFRVGANVCITVGFEGTVVAMVQQVGSGRVYVYGDEHPYISDYLPAQVPFFVSAVTWLSGK